MNADQIEGKWKQLKERWRQAVGLGSPRNRRQARSVDRDNPGALPRSATAQRGGGPKADRRTGMSPTPKATRWEVNAEKPPNPRTTLGRFHASPFSSFSCTVFICVYYTSSFDTLLEGPDIHADFPRLTSPRLVASKRPWVGRLPTDVAQQRPPDFAEHQADRFASSLDELKGGKHEDRDSGWSIAGSFRTRFVRRSDPAS